MNAVYIGDHTILAQTKFKRPIYLESRDISLTPHIALEGDWEPWIERWLDQVMPETPHDSLCIDGGANCGWYSLIFAKQWKRDVLAVEANPRMAELLRKTFAVNGMLPPQGKSRVECAALGHEGADVSLVHTPDNYGSADVVYPMDDGDTKTVRSSNTMVKLDSLVRPKEKVGLIKLDIEGWEPQAIQGAQGVLSENPDALILFEHNAGNSSMIVDMKARGYRLFHVAPPNGREVPMSLEELRDLRTGEMLLFRRPR